MAHTVPASNWANLSPEDWYQQRVNQGVGTSSTDSVVYTRGWTTLHEGIRFTYRDTHALALCQCGMRAPDPIGHLEALHMHDHICFENQHCKNQLRLFPNQNGQARA